MAEASERMSAAALKRLLEAFNAHDIDAVMSFFVDDCVLEMRVERTIVTAFTPS